MTPAWQVWTYWFLVGLTLLATLVQVRNLHKALARQGAARTHPGDGGRLIVTTCDVYNEWLRLAAHGSLCFTLGFLILLRYLPRALIPPQSVTFVIFVGGLALLPVLLLLMSINVAVRDRKLQRGPQ